MHTVRKGHLTCSIPEHMAREDEHVKLDKSFADLRRRLRQHREQQSGALGDHGAHDVQDAIERLLDAEELGPDVQLLKVLGEDVSNVAEEAVDPIAKSDEGNRTSRAQFGRKHTHNEQLAVYCCGVIAGRATMFGAEAITGVEVCGLLLVLL